jgi:hypothetical protein
MIPTIVYQLATQHPPFRSLVCTAISDNPEIRDRAIAIQSRNLFRKFSDAAPPKDPLLIVIDALDECNPGRNDEGIETLRILIDTIAPLSFFKILVTSRVDWNIVDMFASLSTNKLALHYDIEDHIVQNDIGVYLEHKFTDLAHARRLRLPFPSPEVLMELVKRAGTLFIYAATVVMYVSDPKDSPVRRLRQVIDQTASQVPFQYTMLDRIYAQIISEATITSGDPETHADTLHRILASVIMLQESVHLTTLAALVNVDVEETEVILHRLSSVLMFDDDKPVRLYHPSFPDFITDKKRCRDDIQRFAVVPNKANRFLAHRCLEIMNNYLRRDICGIKDASLLNSDIPDLDNRLDQVAPRQLRYACMFWAIHLYFSGELSDEMLDKLTQFTTKHLLHWVEILSLMDKLFVVRHDILPALRHLNVC